MNRAIALLTLCLLPGFVACSSDSSDDEATDAKTLVAIDSADFPTAANCAAPLDDTAPRGAYVAELIDVTGRLSELDPEDSLDPFSVQSSEPVPCGKTIGFAEVTPDRLYELVVRVYPDLDGDPETVDVCTVKDTSVTVTRTDGSCTTELAAPSATLDCYGWSNSSKGLEDPDGGPVLAIEYRTAMAQYCRVAD